MKIFDSQNMNGVIPAMITSFNKDESINKEGIRKIVNYIISEKVNQSEASINEIIRIEIDQICNHIFINPMIFINI